MFRLFLLLVSTFLLSLQVGGFFKVDSLDPIESASKSLFMYGYVVTPVLCATGGTK